MGRKSTKGPTKKKGVQKQPGTIGTKRVKRHRLLYSRYTMDYRSAASIIRTKQNRIGQKNWYFWSFSVLPKKY